MRSTSPSATLWPTCGPRRPARRRRSLPRVSSQAASSCPKPPSAFGQLARQQMDDKRYELTQTAQRLARVHPRRRLNDWLQRLDDAQTSLLRCAKQGARRQRLAWQSLGDRLARVRPALVLRQRREVFVQMERRSPRAGAPATGEPEEWVCRARSPPAPAGPGAGPGARLLDHDGRADREGPARGERSEGRPALEDPAEERAKSSAGRSHNSNPAGRASVLASPDLLRFA